MGCVFNNGLCGKFLWYMNNWYSYLIYSSQQSFMVNSVVTPVLHKETESQREWLTQDGNLVSDRAGFWTHLTQHSVHVPILEQSAEML